MHDIDHTLPQVEPESQFEFEAKYYYNSDTECYVYEITNEAVFEETEEMELAVVYK